MKILQLLHDYLPEHAGGTEVHAHQLALALQKRRHEVLAVFSERDLTRAPGSWRAGQLDGVRTLERMHPREYADVRETWTEDAAAADFAELLQRERPDVVHVQHLATWGPRCVELARQFGSAVVVTLHDYHALCDRGMLIDDTGTLCARGGLDCTRCLERHPLLPAAEGAARAERLAAARQERREAFRRGLAAAHMVVAPSRFLARTFTQAGFLAGTPVEILSPGTQGLVYKPRARRPGKLRLGFVGGLYPEKGCHVLIDALRAVRGARLELHVHGVLEWFPDYVADLRARAAGLDVRFHGRFDPRHVDQVYAGFDLLVVPSLWYENHPLTIQDAFRHGMCVVASRLGGLEEGVQDGISGLLFPAGDARALARCLEQLLADAQLYERLCRDRPRCVAVDEVAERLVALYTRARPRPLAQRQAFE